MHNHNSRAKAAQLLWRCRRDTIQTTLLSDAQNFLEHLEGLTPMMYSQTWDGIVMATN